MVMVMCDISPEIRRGFGGCTEAEDDFVKVKPAAAPPPAPEKPAAAPPEVLGSTIDVEKAWKTPGFHWKMIWNCGLFHISVSFEDDNSW